MERREAVPFDPHHFEKLAREGNLPPPEEVFRDIYRRHHWTGSRSLSGAGSGQEQTAELKRALPELLKERGVSTVLDLPCGDYSWMRQVDLAGIRYIGADLLPELIAPLQAVHTDARHQFTVLDLTSDPLPPADLLFCRDCLVHLSYEDIRKALENFRESRIPLLLTTTFPDSDRNEEIVTGDWRPLNLERPPFNFPPPANLLREGSTEAGGLFADKSLGLWRAADLLR